MKVLIILLVFFTGVVTNAQTNHIINVSNFQFTPASLTIALGDTVTWQWVQGTHTTTSDSTSGTNSWNAPITSSDITFSFVLTAPGLHRYFCVPHGGPGGSGMSGTIQVENTVSVGGRDNILNYSLEQNYPNPFNPSTSIKLSVPVSGEVKVMLFDVLGRKVKDLFSGHLNAGIHTFSYSAGAEESGIYFYTMEFTGEDGNRFSQTRKMMLLK